MFQVEKVKVEYFFNHTP